MCELVSSDPTPRFTGWLRERRRGWRPVVQCDSEASAWDRLLDTGAPGDKCVLPAGQTPGPRRML